MGGVKRLKISELCNVSSGGTPSRNEPKYWNEGTIPWVRSEVCKEGYVISANEYITQKGLEESNAKLFKKKTTLIALVGATKGRTAFLEIEAATNQNIAGLYSLDETKILNKYIFYICRSMYYELIRNLQQYDMLNLGNIRDIKIPVPPLAKQQEIVSEIERYEAEIAQLEQLMAQSSDKKKAVLERYL